MQNTNNWRRAEDGALIHTSPRETGNIPFDPGAETDQHRSHIVVGTDAG